MTPSKRRKSIHHNKTSSLFIIISPKRAQRDNNYNIMPPHSATEAVIDDLAMVVGCSSSHQRERRRPKPMSTRSSAVTFAPVLHFSKETLSLDDYTAEEKSATWYSDEEYAEIKRNVRATLCQWEQGRGGLVKFQHEMRGLEWKTSLGIQRRFLSQSQAISAVLDEQQRQEFNGILDPVKISYVYLPVSSQSASAAHLTALEDERQARFINADDEAQQKKAPARSRPQNRTNRPQRRLSCTAA